MTEPRTTGATPEKTAYSHTRLLPLPLSYCETIIKLVLHEPDLLPTREAG